MKWNAFKAYVALTTLASLTTLQASLDQPEPSQARNKQWSQADLDMFEIAKPYNSTFKLTAHTPFGQFFSASATYIGETDSGEFIALTNAHCVMPWYWGRTWIASFTIDREENGVIEQYPITGVEFHPQWFQGSNDKSGLTLDIVKLKLSTTHHPHASLAAMVDYSLPAKDIHPILNFDESSLPPKPTRALAHEHNKNHDFAITLWKYDCNQKWQEYLARQEDGTVIYLKTLFYDKTFQSVGYGTSGPIGASLSTNDGMKRGTNIPLQYLRRNRENQYNHMISRPLEPNHNKHYGARCGMSGGGLYETTDPLHKKLIGINYAAGGSKQTWIKTVRVLYQSLCGQYLTALSVPMPFMTPQYGEYSIFISLSPLKDWINAPVTPNGPAAADDSKSWLPGYKTAATLTAGAAYLAWSYWG